MTQSRQDDSRSGPEHRHGIKAGPPVQDVFAGPPEPEQLPFQFGLFDRMGEHKSLIFFR